MVSEYNKLTRYQAMFGCTYFTIRQDALLSYTGIIAKMQMKLTAITKSIIVNHSQCS